MGKKIQIGRGQEVAQQGPQIDILGNIYNNILKGLSLGMTLIMLQGSARSGKTYNIMIFLIVRCVEKTTKVTIVRQSLPAIKNSVFQDFKNIMIQMGLWEDKRINKTELKYTFANGSLIEFFSGEDEQKLRGPSRDILYVNEANEISYYAFSMLRQRTYEFTIVDYNPSFTEEHWLFPLITDSRTYHFISTFKDNIFLPKAARDEILSYKDTNPALWRIFGEGQFAIIEGLVFPSENWDIIPHESYPTWLGEEYVGVDWGFTCFNGDTLVMTDSGEVPIREIKAGDMVLTRQGYRKVVRKMNNGVKKVIHKAITINGKTIEIKSTYQHNFNVNGKWKKYGELTERDNLCVLSSLTELSTADTQAGSTQTTTTTSGKQTANTTTNSCITQFMSSIMGVFRTGKLSITKIKTHLITILATYWQLLHRNTPAYTMRLLQNSTHEIKRGTLTPKKIGQREERSLCKDCKVSQGFANIADANLLQRIRTSVFARQDATEPGNSPLYATTLNLHANTAAERILAINTCTAEHAPDNVRISYHGVSGIKTLNEYECEVYDLWVDDVHEYFANGILVHNCDPTVFMGVIIKGDDVYIRELHYETGMKTADIARALEPYRDNYKYCDIDNRLVQELEDAGIPLLTMTRKNADSIMTGIRLMNQRHLHITSDSTNTIKEFRNYVYKKDRHATYQTDLKPIDKFNHCIDAIRYVVYAECGGKNSDDDRTVWDKEELGLFM